MFWSGHNFAHVMTANMACAKLWLDQNIILDRKSTCIFTTHDLISHLWNVPLEWKLKVIQGLWPGPSAVLTTNHRRQHGPHITPDQGYQTPGEIWTGWQKLSETSDVYIWQKNTWNSKKQLFVIVWFIWEFHQLFKNFMHEMHVLLQWGHFTTTWYIAVQCLGRA